MEMSKGSTKIKFPVLKNVEYISVFRNKQVILEVDGKDIEGFTWRQLQIYLGERVTPGLCQYTMKFNDDDAIYNGRIRAALTTNKPVEVEMDNNKILTELKTLKEQLGKAEKSGGISFELLLASTKQGHEAQLSYLNEKLKDKDEKIRELKQDIEELENDLDECSKELSSKSGLAQYLEVGQKILSMKFGNPKPVTLKESDPSDIPEKIITVLGIINWSKMNEQTIDQIANSIQQYLSVLPKEYFKI